MREVATEQTPARLQQVMLLAAQRQHSEAVAQQVCAVRVGELHEVVLHGEAVADLPVRQSHLQRKPSAPSHHAQRCTKTMPRTMMLQLLQCDFVPAVRRRREHANVLDMRIGLTR